MPPLLEGEINSEIRERTAYTVWWISGDQQASMLGGNFTTKEHAEAAIPHLEKIFKSECQAAPWDEDSYWEIEDPEEPDDEDED